MAEDASTPGLRFREAISGDLAVLETCVEKLGERLRPSMNPFLVSMDKVAEIIDQAAQTTKPEGDALYEFLDPIAQEMEIVTEVRDGVQAKELLESHILSLGEAIQMLGWLASEDPISVVEEGRSSLLLSLQPIKEKGQLGDPIHLQWALALESLSNHMLEYVKRYAPQGLVWKEV